jgi:hypothetical protein
MMASYSTFSPTAPQPVAQAMPGAAGDDMAHHGAGGQH